jgi:hypothetical protein
MNGFRKVRPPDEEHKIIVFSPFVLYYINEEVILGFSRLEDSVVTHRESKGSSVTGVS